MDKAQDLNFFSKTLKFFCVQFILIFGLAQHCLFATDSKINPLTIPDIRLILERGVLRVAMHAIDNPPFYMKNDKGEMEGIDVDLAYGIGKLLGVPIKFIRTAPSYDAVVEQVAKGEADIAISKLSITGSRSQLVFYSKPYFNMRKALLMNRVWGEKLGKRKPLEEALATPGAIIGMIDNSSYEAFAVRLFPQTKLEPNDSWAVLMSQVIKGEVAAIFRDEFEVWRSLFNQKDGSIFLMSVVLTNEMDPLAIAVNPKAPGLLAAINLYLGNFYHTLTMNDLIARAKNSLNKPKVNK